METRVGKNSLDLPFGCFEYRHFSCAERRGRLHRGVADVGTTQQRGNQLCPLHLANALAGEPRGVLSASGESPTALGNYLLTLPPNLCYRGSYHSAKTATLSNHRLALVSGDACASDWTSASRLAGTCRSIHLFAPDRLVHSCHMDSG